MEALRIVQCLGHAGGFFSDTWKYKPPPGDKSNGHVDSVAGIKYLRDLNNALKPSLPCAEPLLETIRELYVDAADDLLVLLENVVIIGIESYSLQEVLEIACGRKKLQSIEARLGELEEALEFLQMAKARLILASPKTEEKISITGIKNMGFQNQLLPRILVAISTGGHYELNLQTDEMQKSHQTIRTTISQVDPCDSDSHTLDALDDDSNIIARKIIRIINGLGQVQKEIDSKTSELRWIISVIDDVKKKINRTKPGHTKLEQDGAKTQLEHDRAKLELKTERGNLVHIKLMSLRIFFMGLEDLLEVLRETATKTLCPTKLDAMYNAINEYQSLNIRGSASLGSNPARSRALSEGASLELCYDFVSKPTHSAVVTPSSSRKTQSYHWIHQLPSTMNEYNGQGSSTLAHRLVDARVIRAAGVDVRIPGEKHDRFSRITLVFNPVASGVPPIPLRSEPLHRTEKCRCDIVQTAQWPTIHQDHQPAKRGQ